MKRNQLFFILAGIYIAGTVIYSCSEEKTLVLPDDRLQHKSDLLNSGLLEESSLTPLEQLGKSIYFDKISVPNSMACADCHAPKVGFTGPMAGINIHGSVYRGADAQNFGDRKPPSAAYATFSPVFHYDADEELFIGGNFWDGRATGNHYKDNPDIGDVSPTAAEQALGPFRNPAEHNVPDKFTVLQKISKAKYNSLWETVWGEALNLEETDKNYDRVGIAIAAYEGSSEVNQFTSKYDYYLKGEVELTEQESWGLELFNSEEKGKCALCHISTGSNGIPPLFTDFTFDNLGTPKNPENPVYKNNPCFVDPGLGGFLKEGEGVPDEWRAMADENMGKHKVPTLRNVDKKPGAGFTKAYLHNGVFKSLKEVVHFYNTRDVLPWPPAEVSANVNKDELGNLDLSGKEEDAIVTFMKTLSDGYVLK